MIIMNALHFTTRYLYVYLCIMYIFLLFEVFEYTSKWCNDCCAYGKDFFFLTVPKKIRGVYCTRQTALRIHMSKNRANLVMFGHLLSKRRFCKRFFPTFYPRFFFFTVIKRYLFTAMFTCVHYYINNMYIGTRHNTYVTPRARRMGSCPSVGVILTRESTIITII